MNRSLTNVIFGGIAPISSETTFKVEGTITKTNVDETVEALVNADSVCLVVGYGMAVAKAQYPIAEFVSLLRAKGIKVKYAHLRVLVRRDADDHIRFFIHPVAGRMPGQCNVLLAEASVPYDSKPSPISGNQFANDQQLFWRWTKKMATLRKQT